MTTKQQVSDLQKRHEPLTEAEAVWVLNQEGDEDELVAEVKAMRVGPSATVEDIEIAPEPDSGALEEIRGGESPEGWSDARIAGASASELVDYVKALPQDAERVARLEGDRDGGPRKTVLDAVASVVEEG